MIAETDAVKKERIELSKLRDSLNGELLALAEKISQLDRAADMVGAMQAE